MPDSVPDSRRRFLKTALAGSALAGAATRSSAVLAADHSAATAADTASGYVFLTPSEASFVEALVDHMVPADRHTAKGSDLHINVYFDRTLNGNWGKGDRLYLEGPWKKGLPGQGYQLPLTPAELFRAATLAFDAVLRKTHGKPFAELDSAAKERALQALERGETDLENGIEARLYFSLLYQLTVEGLFADPVYGGNAGKAGWKMVGFPGVIATHTRNIVSFKNKDFPHQPLGIADAS
jgi:gluconate 2-dehydrogenase gamma chain